MENTTTTSIWNKTQDEVTVGDSLKVALVVTAVSAAIPIVIMAGVAGVGAIMEKRKLAKAGRVAIVEANEKFDN